jgi:predicted ATPase/DNA-binding winged helix-turn-helix (wHTH) protein
LVSAGPEAAEAATRDGPVRPTAAPPSDIVSFGPFELAVSARLLTKEGAPVQLGARALDVLIALVVRAHEVVSKRELLAQVWPDTFVDEGSLRFQMAALRKALGDGQGGARYITTVPGRGYCLVAPVSRVPGPKPEVLGMTTTLPNWSTTVVGRDDDVQAVVDQLGKSRFVTVLGPGGIGKTTLAVKAGHSLLEAFAGAVQFVDLGPVGDPALVPGAVASALGLLVSSDPVASLVAYLHDKRVLVILDCCEHVIDMVAALTEVIFARAPQVHMLVTSRETLRVGGETVYHLGPLQSPPSQTEPTAAEALEFSAVQLFLDRAQASDGEFKLEDAEAPVIAEICRKLDGVALAIELAASRVHAYGIRQTARLLDGKFELHWQGRRTALPRHQTLGATLDWSYDLLPEAERVVLRRLSVFAGRFDVEAARAVAGHDDPDGAATLERLLELVNKSLVSAYRTADQACYRLLDTTRAYASAKLRACGEFHVVARFHAAYFSTFLERIGPDLVGLSKVQATHRYGDHLGNVRSALEWSFGSEGDCELGIALAAQAARLFLQLSLLTECHRWTERALACMADTGRGTRRELILQASLGQALMFTRSNSEQVRTAFLRALTLAEELEDFPHQLQLLAGLHIFHERIGDFYAAITFAERSLAVAETLGDEGGIAAGHSFLGISCHLMGVHHDAHEHLVAALSDARIRGGIDFGFDHRNRARITMARNLFMHGYPDQASRMARETVVDAATLEHPVTLCIALIWAVYVHIWSGELQKAEEDIVRFFEHAQRYSLAPYLAVGAGVQGELAIRRGDVGAGIRAVRDALRTLHADRYELLSTAFLGAIAEGLATLGQFEDALAAADAAIELVERQGDLIVMPDLLRIKADILASLSDHIGAEAGLLHALEMSRSHGALAWELRAATKLARLWAKQSRSGAARDLLRPLYERFTEGFGTADLRAARQLLSELR